MFYDKQSEQQQKNYKDMLRLVGSLSNLFSSSNVPMLHYRAHENIFCKYFEAVNLAREDCSADAKKETLGIGLKTWVGNDNQKVAEFGRLRPNYENLTGMDLIKTISEYRNERIRVTKNMHGLTEMIYHIVKRIPNGMQIFESAFDMIDIDNIILDENRGNKNNTYFSDGCHTYHFSTSKNTLYMLFNDMVLMDSFDVEILDDPYEILKNLLQSNITYNVVSEPIIAYGKEKEYKPKQLLNQLCLRLYSTKSTGEKFVAEKSGLNQWNGVRTSNRKLKNGTIVHVEKPRDVNEFYIPYPAEDRARKSFFPPRDTSFDLLLPDGQWISAKVCQAAYKKVNADTLANMTDEERYTEEQRQLEGKAIMSNPNNQLGKWLLRDVFELPIGKKVTYDMLQIFGIDSVMFTKLDEGKYSIDFCPLGTYESFYGLNDIYCNEAENADAE